MSKNFHEARNELKQALASQKSILANLQRMGFTNADREVKSCIRNIRDIERDLKVNYSLAV